MQGAYIFRTGDSIPGFFEGLFGGIFLVKGIPLITQLSILILVLLAVGLAYAHSQSSKSSSKVLCQVCLHLLLALLFLMLLQPWDEVFVNLRHADHWARVGLYSFNTTQMLEGTVEFLPCFFIASLIKLGLSPIDSIFLLGLAGAIALVWACIRILESWGHRWAGTWGMLILILYPPIAFNSGHGFGTTTFVAAVLWSLYFLFYGKHKLAGWLILSLIPLLRLEGAFLILLVVIGFFHRSPWKWKSGLLTSACVLLPTLAMSLYRLKTFGSPIPLPIQYKSSLGNVFYLMMGLRNLAADLFACYGAIALLVIFVCKKLRSSAPNERAIFTTPLVILAVYCFPYYLSGGDWFPSYWGRYLLPFSIFALLAAMHSTLAAWPLIKNEHRSTAIFGFALILVFSSLWPISSYWKFFDQIFSRRRTVAKLHNPEMGRGHYRIENLSQLGIHLNQTTNKNWTIASTEVATIMYYAKRETLDLLGIVNPEIISQPPRKSPGVLRPFPKSAELPYLIFKRINPNLVEKYKPEIVYTFDFLLRDLLSDLPLHRMAAEDITTNDIEIATRRWSYSFKGLIDPVYKGTNKLWELGYRPIIVVYGDKFSNLYFVSDEALEQHLQLLGRAGLKGEYLKFKSDI